MGIRIHIPGTPNENPFFSEISGRAKTEFRYFEIDQFDWNCNGVLVLWPEGFYGFETASEADLSRVLEFIQSMKQAQIPLFYVVHNENPHLRNNRYSKAIYRAVEGAANVMIHLGSFSQKKMALTYPVAEHVVIPHPLYEAGFPKIARSLARKELGIPESAKVLFCAGALRSKEERGLLLQAFNALNLPQKWLLISRTIRLRSNIDFPGRVKLKSILDVKRIHEESLNQYKGTGEVIQNHGVMDNQAYSTYLNAADVVTVSRINGLNSGGLFAGLTAKKIIVGPRLGNMSELLEEMDMPMYLPRDHKDMARALTRGFSMSWRVGMDRLAEYTPERVVRRYDEVFAKFGKSRD